MTYEFHATCVCGYKSRSLSGNTCLCPSCHDLVDVPRLPFRYALEPCPRCAAPMFEHDMLLDILGNGWLITDKPSALTCPKCCNAKVHFHMGAHYLVLHGALFPSPGDAIDGCIDRNGKLEIPWFSFNAATVQHDIPNDIERGQRITLRVASIATGLPADTVQSLFYRRVVTDLSLKYLGLLPNIRR